VTKPVDWRAFQEIVKAIENFWFVIVRLPPAEDSASDEALSAPCSRIA
jgi:hypothetical protein